MSSHQIDFKNINVDKIAEQINSTDPIGTLMSLGMSFDDANKASSGDFSEIGSELNKPLELDFNTIMSKYGNQWNRKLIEYFFIKSKNSEQFTDDEVEAYGKVFKNWFEFIYDIGKLNMYVLDKDLPESRCISIKVDDDHYGMVSFNDHYYIMLLDL